MSNTSSPVSVVFDLQRRTLEGTHEAIHRGIETQRRIGDSMMAFGPARAMNERNYETVRAVVDGYFDAVESTMNVQEEMFGDVRESVDDQLATLEANQAEMIETLEANVRDGPADELLEEYVALLDEQFEAVLEAHEDVEDRTVEAFDGFEGDLEGLQDAFEAHSEDVSRDLEAHSEDVSRDLEAHREEFDRKLDELQDRIEDATASAGEQVDIQVEAVGESLEAIDGIGSTYADRLRDRGIESVEALTQANAQLVAETADVSEDRAAEWIEAAQSSA